LGHDQEEGCFLACISSAIGHAYQLANIQRETLGQLVRSVWARWAESQDNPKPSWIVGWESLEESQKEADRMIGEQLFLATLLCVSAYFGSPKFDPLEI
jgi:hypothetical protein